MKTILIFVFLLNIIITSIEMFVLGVSIANYNIKDYIDNKYKINTFNNIKKRCEQYKQSYFKIAKFAFITQIFINVIIFILWLL